MRTRTTPIEPSTCPDCGGSTRQAFDATKNYVSCRRCGHVFPATEEGQQ